MHRAAPASRAYGRYAVGLPADPGHRRLTRRPQTTADNGQTTTNTTTTARLDRPRSFRNDLGDGADTHTRRLNITVCPPTQHAPRGASVQGLRPLRGRPSGRPWTPTRTTAKQRSTQQHS